ncbi:MAG: hypothetical protein RIG77_22985 [Cyclobacteriaceae bacterium]
MFCLYGGNFKDGFIINSGIFEGTVFIGKEGVFKPGFIVEGGEFKKNFIVQGGNYQQGFKVIGGKFLQQLHIVDGNFDTIEINNEGLNYDLV